MIILLLIRISDGEYLVHVEIHRRVKLAAEVCFSMRHPVVSVST